MGFEGLRSPNGGELDPPLWGTILILVPHPTNLVVNVSPLEKVTRQPTLDPSWGGVRGTYGTEVRGDLWGGL